MLPVYLHPNTGQRHVSIISGKLSLCVCVCVCVCDVSYHWSCYTCTSLSLCLSLQVDTDAGFPACLGAVMKYWFPLQFVAVVRAMCWMWLHCTSLCLWEKGKKGHWGLWMSLTGWLQMQSHNALSCWHEGCVTANKVLKKQKDGQAPWQYHGMIGWHIKTKC